MRDFSEDFLAFWRAYPRKVGKLAAWDEWRRLAPPRAEVLKALLWQVESQEWLRDGGQYIPHQRTYLHQGRWEDEPVVIVAKAKSRLQLVKEAPMTFKPLRCSTHEKNPQWRAPFVDGCDRCKHDKARNGTRQGEPVSAADALPLWARGGKT